VSLFVDTSVWSLALRRDHEAQEAEVEKLRAALSKRESVYTTGLVLQELLQGFSGPKARTSIIERFAPLPMIVPDRDDYVAAAELQSACRRHGVQIGTIDALLARLCIRHELEMLTLDRDFHHAADHIPLVVWIAKA
jgi:hypothetical protein